MNNNVNQPDGEYWQPELETMPREQLRELQVKKLKQTLEVCLKSPFYKKRLGELGITPDDIKTVDDIRSDNARITKEIYQVIASMKDITIE